MSKSLNVDEGYLLRMLQKLVSIPSPTGYTDNVVRFVAEELQSLDIPVELTRRGGIRADLRGNQSSPDRGIVSHLDTIGAMVKRLKQNGRLEIVPVGHWSSRFAEGGRVTVFTDTGALRGTVLPLKASGHVYNEAVDSQPVNWESIEVRLDGVCSDVDELKEAGIDVGNYVAFDPNLELSKNGFVNSRHLDDKAGVASVLAAAQAICKNGVEIPVDCHLLFTISEETGSGALLILHGDIAEMVTVDNGTLADGQNTSEFGVTIALMDSAGPFDYHLSRKLIKICKENNIEYARDVFKYYRSDSASAVSAGNDIRTALACFGVDGSHGYERVHIKSLLSLSALLVHYVQSEPTFKRDASELGSLKGFPRL